MSQNLGVITSGALVVDGIPYFVDTTRGNKQLSSPFTVEFGLNNSSVGNGIALLWPGGSFDGSKGGWTVPEDLTILGYSLFAAQVVTAVVGFDVRVGTPPTAGTGSSLFSTNTLAVGTGTANRNMAINQDVAAADMIRIQIETTGGSVSDPEVSLDRDWETR